MTTPTTQSPKFHVSTSPVRGALAILGFVALLAIGFVSTASAPAAPRGAELHSARTAVAAPRA